MFEIVRDEKECIIIKKKCVPGELKKMNHSHAHARNKNEPTATRRGEKYNISHALI